MAYRAIIVKGNPYTINVEKGIIDFDSTLKNYFGTNKLRISPDTIANLSVELLLSTFENNKIDNFLDTVIFASSNSNSLGAFAILSNMMTLY